jgi:hypothetical protein
MNIGVIRERGAFDRRVALTPPGAQVAWSPAEVIQRSELISKIGRPTAEKLSLCPPQMDVLAERCLTAIGCEIVQQDDGRLPVLAAISEIAGQMTVPIAAHLLRSSSGGRGILLGRFGPLGQPGHRSSHAHLSPDHCETRRRWRPRPMPRFVARRLHAAREAPMTIEYRSRIMPADVAVAEIQSGQRVYIHNGWAEPVELVKAADYSLPEYKATSATTLCSSAATSARPCRKGARRLHTDLPERNRMPNGTTLEETARVADALARAALDQLEVVNLQTYVGTASPFNFNGLVRHYYLRRGSKVADIQVNLLAKGDRKLQSHEIAKQVRTRLLPVANRFGARIKVAEVPPGPPVLQTLVAEVYLLPTGRHRRVV